MDIKDIGGLSEPLKRLVEVARDGIGSWFRPSFVKKNADAKAYELRALADAMSESREKGIRNISYESEGLKISISESGNGNDAALPERTISRLAYQEMQKQQNIEAVFANAAEELKTVVSVSEKKPQQDWIARFLELASNVSNQNMQELWGKILSGEIQAPGNYSLRTLDILRNITQREAEVFAKLGRYVFKSGQTHHYFNGKTKTKEGSNHPTLRELLLLKQAGLVSESDLVYTLDNEQEERHLFTKGKVVNFKFKKTKHSLAFNVEMLTTAGSELMNLLDEGMETSYLQDLKQLFSQEAKLEYFRCYHLVKNNDEYFKGDEIKIE